MKSQVCPDSVKSNSGNRMNQDFISIVHTSASTVLLCCCLLLFILVPWLRLNYFSIRGEYITYPPPRRWMSKNIQSNLVFVCFL